MNIVLRYIISPVKYLSKPSIRSISIGINLQKNMSSPSVKIGAKRIVWMDLEMTGLDIEKDHILEISCLVTDADLQVVAAGPNIVVYQPDEILNSMKEWCMNHHDESGLTQASKKSTITIKEAEKQVLDFVRLHVPEKRCPLAGNSVYMDRLFIKKYMPQLDEYLHYRIIDVSTIKELAKRWFSSEYSRIPQKRFHHRAVDDIYDSIEELKYYRDYVFKPKDVEVNVGSKRMAPEILKEEERK